MLGSSARQAARPALYDDVDLDRDRALVERAQRGDQSAFDDLYQRYYQRLYRACVRRLRDQHEAEDVAQEAFARAWRALPNFAGDRKFYPWISVIAAHLCTDVQRRRSRSTPVAEFHPGNVASVDDGGEDMVMAAVDTEIVSEALAHLSERHQRILQLREGSGWSYQRIADHEGVGITAVETLLWRARQALKREFAAIAGAEGRLAAAIGALVGGGLLSRMLSAPKRLSSRLAAKVGQWLGSPGSHLGTWVVAAGTAGAAVAAAAVGVLGASHPATTTKPAKVVQMTPAARSGSSERAGTGVSGPLGTSSRTSSPSGTPGSAPASPSGTPPLGTGTGTGLPSLPPIGGTSTSIPPAAGGLAKTLNGAAGTLGGTAKSLGGGLGSAVKGLGSTLPSPLGSVLNSTGNTVEGVTSRLGSALNSVGTSSGGTSSGGTSSGGTSSGGTSSGGTPLSGVTGTVGALAGSLGL
ncbi:MAG: sigma-70 family RNA polymerase sigma factor [Actinobacteria bacterium]|nr:sigma-70 family RNA polymerase sigma factor [Actinomycetota bacterium]